jgi:cob(I)alamin adenosyltransferase
MIPHRSFSNGRRNRTVYHFNNSFFAADTGASAGNISDREQLKKHKLEYLYEAESALAVYPLLGSCLRALGKEWTVKVLSNAHLPLFTGLKSLLKKSDTLLVQAWAMDQPLALEAESLADLVIIEAAEKESAIKTMRDVFLGKAHVMVGGRDAFRDDYDLISRFISQDLQPHGVIAFTGQGKGKSTSAFGMALKAVIEGGRAAIVQWFKEPKGPRGTWSINEHYFPEYLKDSTLIEFYPTGAGFFSSPHLDRVKGSDAYAYHRDRAVEGVTLAKQLIASGKYAVVVLDELVDTLAEVSQNIPQSLLDKEILRELLSYSLAYPATQLVVTGRRVTPVWSDLIQHSYLVEEVRHPWSSKGKAAISGLDF